MPSVVNRMKSVTAPVVEKVSKVAQLPVPLGGFGHLVLYLSVWLLMLVVSLSIQQSFSETVDLILEKEDGWRRVVMHWTYTIIITTLFFVCARMLSNADTHVTTTTTVTTTAATTPSTDHAGLTKDTTSNAFDAHPLKLGAGVTPFAAPSLAGVHERLGTFVNSVKAKWKADSIPEHAVSPFSTPNFNAVQEWRIDVPQSPPPVIPTETMTHQESLRQRSVEPNVFHPGSMNDAFTF